MNTLLQELSMLVAGLIGARGTPADALAALRRLLAAWLIQQQPGFAPVPDDPDADPALLLAAREGEAMAAEWAAAGVVVSWTRESYVEAEELSRLSAEVLGPFIDDELNLVRYVFFRSEPFLRIDSYLFSPLEEARTTLMLLPAGTRADENSPTRWFLPAGTVWLKADRLAPEAPGWAVLRIASGVLDVANALPPPGPDGTLFLQMEMLWTLRLEPERPEASDPQGIIAERVELTLPQLLVVESATLARVEGPLAIAGIGSPLVFERPSGSCFTSGNALAFPYEPDGAEFVLDGRLSPLLSANGKAPVAAIYTVPLCADLLATAGPAAHGGSVSMLLGGPIALRTEVSSGHCLARDSMLHVSANTFSWHVRLGQCTLAFDLSLWTDATTQARTGAAFGGMRFTSRRRGPETLSLQAGRLTNLWDGPLAASGRAFGFEGLISHFALVAERDGSWRACCRAQTEGRLALQGYALENLYLHVQGPSRAAWVASGSALSALDEGHARLAFHVRVAQPMLPDPYAANWQLEHLDFAGADSALRADASWSPAAAPTWRSSLHAHPSFPVPPDAGGRDADRAVARYRSSLHAEDSYLAMLDLSGREQWFGIALEGTRGGEVPLIDSDNRLNWPLHGVRLFLQPQVQWEPVHVPASDDPPMPAHVLLSRGHGGPTLVGAAHGAPEPVPALPGHVGRELVASASGRLSVAALFGLPFGLHAFVHIERQEDGREAGADTLAVLAQMHQPDFAEQGGDVFEAARQLRLIATGARQRGADDPSRGMPGLMTQTPNLVANPSQLDSVLNEEVRTVVNHTFDDFVPLHLVDLSGAGLSTFSQWRRADPPPLIDGTGVTQVRFDVLVGRTAYEVIELQSRLWAPQARMVRTVILERRNNAQVRRHDSGWTAIEDGDCTRYARIDKGVVGAYRNIRNVRVTPRPWIQTSVPGSLDEWVWQEVLYDADLHLKPDPGRPVSDRTVPIRDHVGYIQMLPVDKPGDPSGQESRSLPRAVHFDALMVAVGKPIGGALDATVSIGGTLTMRLAHLEVARDPVAPPRFTLAVRGSPVLPRAAQWAPVHIAGATGDVAPVASHHGVPVIQRRNEAAFVFRDPAKAYQPAPADEYGFLMSTPSARVLFPAPSVLPGTRSIEGPAPLVADPAALSQSSGLFPRPPFALRCIGATRFEVSADAVWKLVDDTFHFSAPVRELTKGGEWSIQRAFQDADPTLKLALDGLAQQPWALALERPDDLELHVDALSDAALFTLRSFFKAFDAKRAGLSEPQVVLGKALEDLQELVDALGRFTKIGLDIDVDVRAGSGPQPSFVIALRLNLRVPAESGTRIDIGVGKFMGRFEIDGELEATPQGVSRGRIGIGMHGDVQQGIIPPVLFAGGQFRFVVTVDERGKPLVDFGLGTVASVGGDLIKNLVELEGTVRYGYTLLPQTLQPGVMLGMEVRAKLLAGLLGLSFSADALARIQRVDLRSVVIWCEIRAAATVQVAWLLKESREVRTQFEQKLPMEGFALLAGLNPIAVAAASVSL